MWFKQRAAGTHIYDRSREWGQVMANEHLYEAPSTSSQHPDDQSHNDLNDKCQIRGQWRGGPEKPSIHKPPFLKVVLSREGTVGQGLTNRAR